MDLGTRGRCLRVMDHASQSLTMDSITSSSNREGRGVDRVLMVRRGMRSMREKSVVLETGIIGGWHFFLVPANNPVS